MRRFILALMLFALLATAADAQQRTRRRVDLGTDTTQTIDITGGGTAEGVPLGTWLRQLRIDVTGSGTVTYSLTHRLCGSGTDGSASTCSAWESTALASGTITAGADPPGIITLELTKPRDEYRLILTVTAGTPSAIRVWALYQ